MSNNLGFHRQKLSFPLGFMDAKHDISSLLFSCLQSFSVFDSLGFQHGYFVFKFFVTFRNDAIVSFSLVFNFFVVFRDDLIIPFTLILISSVARNSKIKVKD